MKNLMYSLVILLVVLFLASCDRAKKDAEPEVPTKANQLTTKSGRPVVVDLVKRHNLTSQSQFLLVGNLSYGQASFVNNQGIMMYRPNNVTSNVIETINYQICQGGACQNYNLPVQVLASNSTFDSTEYCQQGAFPDIRTLYLPLSNNNVMINVLANDYFCNGYNPNSLQVVSQPFRGSAQVVQGTNPRIIRYTYNPILTVAINPDVFVYRVAAANDSTDWRYAAVVVNIVNPTNNCPVSVVNDQYTINQNMQELNIFANDAFCLDSLATDSTDAFQIVQAPLHGTIGAGASFGFTKVRYLKNSNYVGQDSFTYRLKHINGTISQATVNLNVQQTACNITLNSDNYIFPNTQISNNTVDLLVLNNDILCNANYTLSLLSTSVGGVTLNVQNNNSIRCVLPSANYTGTITFTYSVMANGVIYTANATLTITN